MALAVFERFNTNRGEFVPTSLRRFSCRNSRNAASYTNKKINQFLARYRAAIYSILKLYFYKNIFFYIAADPSKALIAFTHNRASHIPDIF